MVDVVVESRQWWTKSTALKKRKGWMLASIGAPGPKANARHLEISG